MNDWRAGIEGPWTGTGHPGNPYKPLVVAAYNLLDYSQEGGSQPPNGTVIITADPISADKLGAISLDSRFTVLWSEEILPEE